MAGHRRSVSRRAVDHRRAVMPDRRRRRGARGVIAALDMHGASTIATSIARDPDKAARAARRHFGLPGRRSRFEEAGAALAERRPALINATPARHGGLRGDAGGRARRPRHDAARRLCSTWSMRRCETALLAAARGSAGCGAIDGLTMLIGQAARGVRAFLRKRRPAPARCRIARAADVMIILGLTGSIGMGKSTVARMFADEGVPVFDADAAVHRLQGPEGALVAEIEAAFPGHDRRRGRRPRRRWPSGCLAEPAALRRLEALVHPGGGARARGVPRRQRRRAGGRARHPLAVRERRRRPGRQGRRGLRRRRRCSARGRSRGPA